jgi:uncharacterized protein (DUF1800 family)
MGHALPQRPHAAVALILFLSVILGGCTGATKSSSTSPSPSPSPSPAPTSRGVAVNPATVSVREGTRQQFSATVDGVASSAVTWTVNGISGGNGTVGTIDSNGLYSTPGALPNPNTVTVGATTQATPSGQGTSAVTLENPIPIITAMSPTTVGLGLFNIQVSGVHFVPGAVILFGQTPLTTKFVSSEQLTATGGATIWGTVPVTVQNPNPGVISSTTSELMTVINGQADSPAATVRFLEESTFGPTPALVTQVQQIGFAPFLNNQFSAPASTYPDPAASVSDLTPTQQVFFTNALSGADQLRQRVAFALSEIWVTSGNTLPPQAMAPYMRLLSQDAFTNYRTIMQDVTLSPAMGAYLNMVNNDKPNAGANTHANENYARELMQLFTLGLYALNADGSLQLDSSNNPIPSYDQTTVEEMARAFTGWTYPTQPGSILQKHNPTYWLGPMVAFDSNHDMAAKTLLNGTTLPAGQTAAQDLKGALDNLFNHPNVGPFISKELIQRLVTSNPSPAYVSRVAAVFASGTFSTFGSGQRGDMKAVIASILLDPEARRGDDPNTVVATDGHLREPILYVTNLLRAFGATSDGLAPLWAASSLSESPLRSPSVFNFFPPNYQIPGTMLLGPEFDLQTTATALARINFVNSSVYWGLGSGTTVDFTTYANLAGTDVNQLVNALDTLMLHGTLSTSSRASILAAVNAVPSGSNQNLHRAKAAIYLIASSSQYQVEY